MPYITRDRRGQPPEDAGELNYALCKICLAGDDTPRILWNHVLDYLVRRGFSYQRMTDVIGALDGAYEELLRRTDTKYPELLHTKYQFREQIINPYEDTKITENGDIL